MNFFKNRFCKTCGLEYEPTGTIQKYCKDCLEKNKKIFNKQYQKKFRDKQKENKRCSKLGIK